MTAQEFRSARRAMALTQAELAELSGLRQSMISFYETGRRSIPPYIARLIECLSAHRGGN